MYLILYLPCGTVPDIIKFTYYHCTSLTIVYIVLEYTVLHLSTMLLRKNVKGFTHYYDYSTEYSVVL